MGVLFIFGTDAFLVEREALDCIRETTGGTREIFDGNLPLKSLAESLRAAIDTPSLFGEQPALWLKSPNFLREAPSERDESFVASIFDLLKKAEVLGVPLFISAYGVDRRLKHFKYLQKTYDNREVFGDGKTFLAEEIKRRRLSFPLNLQNRFLEKTGDDLRFIDGELEKLQLYHEDNQPITAEDIDYLVCVGPDDRFFEPVDALFRRNWSRLRAAMETYSGDARPLIAAFQSRVRLLIQMKAMHLQNFSRQTMDRQLQRLRIKPLPENNKSSACVFMQNPYYLFRLAELVDAFSLKSLFHMQRQFTRLFQRQISSPRPIIFEDIVLCLEKI
jgi:DNA polymerase III delta subunit